MAVEKSTFPGVGRESCYRPPRPRVVSGVEWDHKDPAAIRLADEGNATFGPLVRHREVAVSKYLPNLGGRDAVPRQVRFVVVVPL